MKAVAAAYIWLKNTWSKLRKNIVDQRSKNGLFDPLAYSLMLMFLLIVRWWTVIFSLKCFVSLVPFFNWKRLTTNLHNQLHQINTSIWISCNFVCIPHIWYQVYKQCKNLSLHDSILHSIFLIHHASTIKIAILCICKGEKNDSFCYRLFDRISPLKKETQNYHKNVDQMFRGVCWSHMLDLCFDVFSIKTYEFLVNLYWIRLVTAVNMNYRLMAKHRKIPN